MCTMYILYVVKRFSYLVQSWGAWHEKDQRATATSCLV